MALAILTPAPLSAVTALAFPSGRAPARHLQVMTLQAVRSESLSVAIDDAPALVIGLWPLAPLRAGERFFELWLLISRSAVPHFVRLRRFARLMLSRLAESGPVRIRALVRLGHAPGERMARLVGMARIDERDGFSCWEWVG